MPDFTSLAEADAWRATNAPPRKPLQSSPKKEPEVAKKTADISETTTTKKPSKPDGGSDPTENDPAPERIDVAGFIDPNADFVAQQIRSAEEVAQITYGILKLRAEKGEPNAIAAAIKNWHEASDVAHAAIKKFVELKREVGELLTFADIEDVIATDLEDIRKLLKRLGRRAAPAANPADPALAERAIAAEVDKILTLLDSTADRIRLELASETPADEPALAS